MIQDVRRTTPQGTVTRRARWVARSVVGLLAAALLASPVVASVGASADDLDDKKAAAQAQQRKIEAQRETLQADLEDTSAALQKAVLDLNTVEAKLPVAQADLDAANAKVASTQREQALLAQRLADAQEEVTTLGEQVDTGAKDVAAARSDVAGLARQSMRSAGGLSSLGVVTGAQSPEQFVDDHAIARTVARTQTRDLAALQRTQAVATNREARLHAVQEEVASLKKQADAKVAEAQTAQAAAAERKKEVDALLAQQTAKKAAIQREKTKALASLDENKADLAAAKQQVTTYVKEIEHREALERAAREAAAKKAAAEAKKKAAEDAKKKKGSGSGGSGSGSGSGGGSGSGSGGGGGGGAVGLTSSGVLAWPVDNSYVTSPFGWRLHPILHYYRMHTGVDLHAPCGVPIHAAAAGYVVSSGWVDGYGNRVIVDHGKYKSYRLLTTYNHMVRYVVHPGEHVSQGEVVGYAGNYGLSTGCHLHFEVMENSTYVDPMTFL